MFKRLFRLLLTLVCVGVLIWFLAPRIFDNAANSLISSASSSIQGMAEFVPAGVNNDKQGNLQINLSGLTPNATYQITLDRDQCGGASTPLRFLKTNGNGNLYAEISLTSIDFSKTWYLDVLQEGQSVACGLLQTNKDAGTQVIASSTNAPDVFGPQGTPSAQPTPGTTSLVNNPTSTQNSDASNRPITTGLPNTGAAPGDNQQYDNTRFPRKY